MKIIIAVVAALVWVQNSRACEIEQTTPTFHYGSYDITEFGTVNFSAKNCEPGVHSWTWHFEGQDTDGDAPTYSISPSTGGLKVVTLTFTQGTGGGTSTQNIFLGKRPVLSVSAGNCIYDGNSPTSDRYVEIQTSFSNVDGSGGSNSWALTSWMGASQVDQSKAVFRTGTKGSYSISGFAVNRYSFGENNSQSFFVPGQPQTVNLVCPNLPPIITSATLSSTLSIGVQAGPEISAFDPDDESVTKYTMTATAATPSSLEVTDRNQLIFTPNALGTASIELRAKDQGGAISAPVTLTYEAVNNYPTLSTIGLSPANPALGESVVLSSSVTDGDGHPIAASWELTRPSGSSATISPRPRDNNESLILADLITDVEGPYTVKLAVSDGFGGVAEVSRTFSVSGTAMNFKILLGGDEYLFDDCAPADDPCRSNKEEFKGGEFLVNDTITLKADEAASSYNWTVKRLDNGVTVNLTGSQANYPIPAVGDYEVKLIAGGNSISSVKKFRAQQTISGNVTPSPYYQIDYPLARTFGYSQTIPIRKRGCLLTDTASIFQKNISEQAITPVSMDQFYVSRKDYLGDADLSLESAVATHNLLSDVTKLSYVAPQILSFEELEKLARKRTYAIFEVHSPGVVTSLPAADVPYCRTNGITDFDRCHSSLKHFIILDGITYEGGEKRLGIIDPENKTRRTLSSTPYLGARRNLRKFSVIAGPPLPQSDNSLIQILIKNPNINFQSLKLGNRATVNLSNRKGFASRKFDGGYLDDLRVVDPAADAPDSAGGGLFLVLPQFQEGNISFSLTSQVAAKESVVVQVRGRNGLVNFSKNINVSFLPGETKSVNFVASKSNSFHGSIEVEKIQFFKNKRGEKSASIKARLNTQSGGNGFNIPIEGVHLNFGQFSQTLDPSQFQVVGNTSSYLNFETRSGVRSLRISEEGELELELVGIDLRPILNGSRLVADIQIGDDFFTGFLKASQVGPMDPVSINFNKLKYTMGERAEVSIVANLGPQNPELELYLAVEVNGQRNLVTESASNVWIVKSPRLAIGNHSLKAQLYVQSKRLSAEVKRTTEVERKAISQIDERLANESDQEIIEDLASERAKRFSRIDELEMILNSSRKKLGGFVEKIFIAE